MTWDSFQREVLAELGHVLYRTGTADALAGDVRVADPSASDSAPGAALLARLARAAGLPTGALPAALHEPDALARLRGNAAAKRALWPQLRTLRSHTQ